MTSMIESAAIGKITVNNGADIGRSVQLFKSPTINSAAELTSALKFAKTAYQHQLLNSNGMNNTQSKAQAELFMDYILAILHNVAVNPAIAGDVNGISEENARLVASEAIALLSSTSARANELCKTEIARQTLSAATIAYTNGVLKCANACDVDGHTTYGMVASAQGLKVNPYPGAIGTYLMAIQNEYDALRVSDSPALQNPILRNIVAKYGLAVADSMNSVAGAPQLVCQIAVDKCTVHMQNPAYYRRDTRTLAEGQQYPTTLMFMSTAHMRCVIAAAFEMSIVLGHAKREIRDSPSHGAPKITVCTVKHDSPFGNIIRLAAETKRFFNAMGRKDFGGDAKILPPAMFMWKSYLGNNNGSYDPLANGGHFVFRTGNLPPEIESRLRIADVSSDSSIAPLPNGEIPSRPGTKTKCAPFPYLVKHADEVALLRSAAGHVVSPHDIRSFDIRNEVIDRMFALAGVTDASTDMATVRANLGYWSDSVKTICDYCLLITLARNTTTSLIGSNVAEVLKIGSR